MRGSGISVSCPVFLSFFVRRRRGEGVAFAGRFFRHFCSSWKEMAPLLSVSQESKRLAEAAVETSRSCMRLSSFWKAVMNSWREISPSSFSSTARARDHPR